MKETTMKPVPAKIEMQQWLEQAARILLQRCANPQDLNDAFLAVHYEIIAEDLLGRVGIARMTDEEMIRRVLLPE